MVGGHPGANLVAVLNHVELEAKSMSDLVQIPNQPMVVTNVQVQHQRQRNVIHITVQYMEDGQLGANQVAVLSHVEQEARNMSGLVQIQNHSMVETNVQVQHQRQSHALLSTVQLMVDGLVGLNLEAVPNHVELVSRNTFAHVLILNLHMVVRHALEVQNNTPTVTHISVEQNTTLTLDTKNQIENI